MNWFNRKPPHQQQVDAAITVASNLYEHTLPGQSFSPFPTGNLEPSPLLFDLPDSRCRYLVFCFATMAVTCSKEMTDPNAIINECFQSVVKYTTSTPERIQQFFGNDDNMRIVDSKEFYLQKYMNDWSKYLDLVGAGNSDAASGIVSTMIRAAESDEPMRHIDEHRLRQLVLYIEHLLPVMTSSFIKLVQ